MNIERLNKALSVWQMGPVPNDEYHSSTGYLSNSFIGDFISCEYSSVIKYALKAKSEFNINFAVGHIVEAEVFGGIDARDKMLNKRYKDNAFSKRDGKPLKWVNDCSVWANSILRHDHLKSLLRSEGSIYHKVINFDMHGMKWRMEIDYLNLNKSTEIDLKTTGADFTERYWNEDTRCKDLTFIDKWNYHRQRAIYQIGIRSEYDEVVQPRILAVSKSNSSVKLFKFDDQDRLDHEIKSLIPVVDRIKEVISGESEPYQCGKCSECVDSEDVMKEVLTSSYCAPWP